MKRMFTLSMIVILFAGGWSFAMAEGNRRAADTSDAAFFDITDFGAVGDGETENTAAFAKAIDAAAAVGGGTVFVPAGKFVSGAINLQSNITLHVEAGGTILGSEDIDDYPVVEGRWEGTEQTHYSSLIQGFDLENIAIEGRGTIDARGHIWWPKKIRKNLPHARGRLIGLYRCKNVLIAGLTLKNSPAWTVNPIYCDNVTVTGLTIINPEDSPNTDGINPDSSRNVRISDCHIDVGDDCITIKSGRDEDGRRVGIPCENITVTNCTMLAGHGGVVIGSEMSGGVKNVTITNCVFDGTDNGIRMKTQRGRGGTVENIRVSNIVMRNVDRAIRLNMHYHRIDPEPVSERTPCFRNIHVSNITVVDTRLPVQMRGLAEMPIDNVTISNANFDVERGIECRDATNFELHDVTVNTEKGPALIVEDVSFLEIDGFKTRAPHADEPVVRLENVSNAWLHGCLAVDNTQTFLAVTGERSGDILLTGNHLAAAATTATCTDGAKKEAVTVR